ncbi:MAG TPA: AraC family transcriptional regulator [Polyangiaceae bacterium]|nr:AraC family transcriptional regulator [Polyangiaceae bacterium]
MSSPVLVASEHDERDLTSAVQVSAAQPPTVPAILVENLLEVVKQWNVSADALLSTVGLHVGMLEDPWARLPVARMCTLLERARAMTGEPALGYHLGLHTRATLYGFLGFAALSASTLRDALELAVAYAPTFSTTLRLDLHVDGRTASIGIEERVDLGSARDIVLISMAVGLREIGKVLTGTELVGWADFAFPEPGYRSPLPGLMQYAHFGQPTNRVYFDAGVLDLPIVMADPGGLKLAREQCERELREIGADVTFVARARRALVTEDGMFLSLEEVAERLALSARTLRRRLAAHGTTFSDLVDAERRDRALHLFRTSRLSTEAVAQRLAYSKASTLVRAFRRWTGTTPAGYRRSLRGSRDGQKKSGDGRPP